MANGWFDFVNGQTLPASRVQDYLMNQTVMVFASATARNTALTAPTEGMFAYLADTNGLTYYDGAAWLDFLPGAGGTAKLDQFLLMGA